jgi:lipopolysaccharide export system ATP-binding protein
LSGFLWRFGEGHEISLVDILSYLRRFKQPGDRAPIAEDDAINLETIGGVISNSYVDIASTAAPAEKVRTVERVRTAERDKSAGRATTEERPLRRPEPTHDRQLVPQPDYQGERPAEPHLDREPSRQIPQARERQPAPPPASRRASRPVSRQRRRTEGNGAVPDDRKGMLAVHGIEKSFVGRMVVKGVSLNVRKGEAVGLLGPNGAGKTTVFYMTTGLISADKGRIELNGRDITKLPMYQRARLGIGYLPQEASIFRGLNVEDNIRAVLEVIEPDAKRREHDLNALLDEFNITRLRKTPSIALSGGERRRVEIARALATRPSYMLLDEPFAGIDPIAVGDIQALVRHLTNRGIGVLITDHNVRETLGLTDRAYIIYSGEVLMEGRPDDIVNNPDVRRLYLGEEFRL